MNTTSHCSRGGLDALRARGRGTAASLVILLLALLAGGCGGGGGGPAISSIYVSPADFAARTGDVVSLVAVAGYVTGPDKNVTTEVTWHSSNTAAGVVSATGQFTAGTGGRTQVTAAKGSVTSPAVNIDVTPLPVLLTANYFPLGIASQWDYTGTEVSPTGVRARAVTITARLSVSRQTVLDNSVWYEVLVKGSDPLETPTYRYMRHDTAGLVELQTAANGGSTVVVKILDSALSAGTTWSDPEDAQRTFTIASVTEHLDVPAGSYDNCVKVVESDPGTPPEQYVSWYKSGVGMVQWQQIEGPTVVLEQQLVHAQIGQL